MKILVIGDGKVGQAIIQHTCQEGHEITIIDNDPKVVEDLVNLYDVDNVFIIDTAISLLIVYGIKLILRTFVVIIFSIFSNTD